MLFRSGEILDMLKIDDRQLDKQILEIIKKTGHQDASSYIKARVAADHKLIKQNKRLSI